jgi:hypothetical protein
MLRARALALLALVALGVVVCGGECAAEKLQDFAAVGDRAPEGKEGLQARRSQARRRVRAPPGPCIACPQMRACA